MPLKRNTHTVNFKPGENTEKKSLWYIKNLYFNLVFHQNCLPDLLIIKLPVSAVSESALQDVLFHE